MLLEGAEVCLESAGLAVRDTRGALCSAKTNKQTSSRGYCMVHWHISH